MGDFRKVGQNPISAHNSISAHSFMEQGAGKVAPDAADQELNVIGAAGDGLDTSRPLISQTDSGQQRAKRNNNHNLKGALKASCASNHSFSKIDGYNNNNVGVAQQSR